MARRDEYLYSHQIMLNGANATTAVNNNRGTSPTQNRNGNLCNMNTYPTAQGYRKSYNLDSYPTIGHFLMNNTFPQSYQMHVSQQTSTQVNVGMLPYGANDLNPNISSGVPVTELGNIPSYDPQTCLQGYVNQQAPLAQDFVGMNGIQQHASFGQMQGNARGNCNMATENVLQNQTLLNRLADQQLNMLLEIAEVSSQQYQNQNHQVMAGPKKTSLSKKNINVPYVTEVDSNHNDCTNTDENDEVHISEIYEKLFNIQCDENEKMNWYKNPSSNSESGNRKRKSLSTNDASCDIVEPSTKSLQVEKERTLPLDAGKTDLQGRSTACATSNAALQTDVEQTHAVKARPGDNGEEKGINLPNGKTKINNPHFTKSRNLFEDISIEKSPDNILQTNGMKEQQNVEFQTVFIDENSYDSDSTFPYVDEEKLLPNPEDSANPEDDLIISGGVMEFASNMIRFVIKEDKQYVPLEDVLRIYRSSTIQTAITQTDLSTKFCSEIEAKFFGQLADDLTLISEGDKLVDAAILQYVNDKKGKKSNKHRLEVDDPNRKKFKEIFNKVKNQLNKKNTQDEKG